jgi:ankyrin repeat protein
MWSGRKDAFLEGMENGGRMQMRGECIDAGDMDERSRCVKYSDEIGAIHSADIDPNLDLCRFAAEGDVAPVILMLQHGVSANAIDYGGRSALQLSTANGHQDIVKLLLIFGADVYYTDRLGRCALDDAIWEGHFEIEKIIRTFVQEITDMDVC